MDPVINLSSGVYLYDSTGPSDVPPNAIKAGLSPNGMIYVGAATFEGVIMPAKVIPQEEFTYFAYYGVECRVKKKTYLVLSEGYQFHWEASTNGDIPLNAVRLGENRNGEPFYVGKVTVDDEECVGKIVKSHKTCYVPTKGKEVQVPSYQVLVVTAE